MIKRKEIQVNCKEDLEALKQDSFFAVSKEKTSLQSGNIYLDDETINTLFANLGNKCKKILIEFPYYDRDYLSTFYNIYSKKLKGYDKRCCRLILFDGEEELFGYITLRPTESGTKIGKTYIEPKYVFENKNANEVAHIVVSSQTAHINDERVELKCFPWMSQQDMTVCAHVALWSLIRHASAKSVLYAELSLGDIAEKVENYMRKIPAIGLTPEQMSTILIKSGFATSVRNSSNRNQLMPEMIAYIDSGLPFIGVISKYEHAVAVIGYTLNKNNIKLMESKYEQFEDENGVKKQTNIVLHSTFINNLIVNDDQYFPYQKINEYFDLAKRTSTNDSKDISPIYLPSDIDYMVVPLYNRVQLSYKDVYTRFMALNDTNEFIWAKNVNRDNPIVARFILTTANDFKSFVSEQWDDINSVATIFSRIETGKCIWCIELSSFEHYKNDLVDSIVVVDSTCSIYDTEPFLFVRDKCGYRYYDDMQTYEVVFDNLYDQEQKVWKKFSQGVEEVG